MSQRPLQAPERPTPPGGSAAFSSGPTGVEPDRPKGLDVLLVEDDAASRTALSELLSQAGHRVIEAADGTEAAGLIAARAFDMALVDVRLPKMDGLTLLRRLKRLQPGADVILMTGFGSVADAVAAFREGAADYLVKPFDRGPVLEMLRRLAERRELERTLKREHAQLAEAGEDPVIVGRAPSIVQLVERIETISESEAPVLITGESGTGKELVARVLHARSPRRQGPFVAVNCAAFPEMLLEAELFGHERGAFTGALRKRDGRFKAADGGTLLLDEVAEIPLQSQAKLLRVLQEGRFEPLGTNATVTVNVRIVSATHQNLKDAIAAGRFREDLYYRLNVLDLSIPPLRERKSDLPLLLDYFLRRFTPRGQPMPRVAPRAWAALVDYGYPGNVREFAHVVERAVVLARGKELDVEHLPSDIAGALAPSADAHEGFRALAVAAREFEREYLLRALHMAAGKRGPAAELLSISRKSLWEKLRLHGISDDDLDDESP